MSGKKQKQEGVPITVRIDEAEHEVLARISGQVGWSLANLARLGLKNLVGHVRETGELPLPKVDLSKEEVAA